ILLLDWNVPGLSGLELLAWIRRTLSPPPGVLMVTARNSAHDIVTALDAGADDFIVKPVDRAVLLARMSAVLRRLQSAESAATGETIAGFLFEPATTTVVTPDGPCLLTAKEFALALTLFRNANRPLSRAYLMETVWGRRPDLATRTLDAHVSRLRSKLNLHPEQGYRLAPVYSFGYRLEVYGSDQGRETGE
ncbi:MAG TPA: response regulator transcription factor, partial [Phenylobacterium sp.]|nr:response regulator transcription factor [Phenylobacterium sp.]